MTREEYNRLFHKFNLNLVAFKMLNNCDKEVLELVNFAILQEREECAKVCESLWRIDGQFTADEFANAIRARTTP